MATIAIFGGSKSLNSAARLVNEWLITLFGSVENDYTTQKLEPGVHEINVFAMFGSVEPQVPEDVAIQLDAMALFGSSEIKNKTSAPMPELSTAPVKIIVRGIVLFGSIEVKRKAVRMFNDAPPMLEQYEQPIQSVYDGNTTRL